MKVYLKKALSILLAFVMLFGTAVAGIAGFGSSIASFFAGAEEGSSGETSELEYAYDEATESVYFCGTIYEWLDIVPDDLDVSVLMINDNGKLRISGGAIPDYTKENPAPWAEEAADISSVAILDGVTAIGSNAFSGCSAITAVFVPESVETIGENAFSGCSSLSKVYYDGTWEEWNALVPDNIAVGLETVGFSSHAHDTSEPKDREVYREPTCYDAPKGNGYYSDIYCETCLTVYIPYKAIDTVPHTYPTDENGEMIYTAKEEYTCEEVYNGLVKYSECLVCGVKADTALSEDEEKLVKVVHDWENIALVNEKGEAVSCDDTESEIHNLSLACKYENCDETSLVPYDVKEHSPDGEYEAVVVEADCVTDGYTEYKCAVCKNKYNVDEEAAWGHDYEWVVEQEATCQSSGLKVQACQNEGCDSKADREYTSVIDCIAVIDEEKSYAPTCRADGMNYYKCDMCGRALDEKTENLPALGHSETFELVTYPDCTKGGEKITRCSHEGCDETKTENIPAGQHSWSEKYFAPECGEIGYTVVVCSNCGAEKEGSRVDDEKATDHTWSDWEVLTPAACGVDKVEIRYCTAENCPEATEDENGETVLYSETKTIENTALEHDWAETSRPTFCNEDGVITYVCNLCEEDKEEAYDGVGHTNTEEIISPTCTAEGYTIFTCTKCPNKYVGDFVPAVGHKTGEWETVTPAECEKAGEKIRYCAADGCEYSETAEIPATGHTAVDVKAADSDCTETGVSEDYTYCSACNAVLNEDGSVNADKKVEDYIVAAKGHTSVEDAAVAATCTETGLTAGSHCSVCGDVLTAQETVDALGHEMGEWETAVEAECEADGEMIRSCTREGCEYTETDKISATGHTSAADAAVAATCTATGLTEGSHCSVCGEVLTAQETVDALGHEMGEWETAVEAECESEGEMIRSCTREGCKYSESKTIPATGHTSVADAAVAATCTETGLTAGSHCSVCNSVLVAQKTVSALNHDMSEWKTIKEADCKNDGQKRQDCNRADCDHYVVQTIASKGHDWSEWLTVKAATCEEIGKKERTCSTCGTKEYGDIAKTEHKFGSWKVSDEATAFEAGEEERFCSFCGEAETRSYELTFFEKIAYIFTSGIGLFLDAITQIFSSIG